MLTVGLLLIAGVVAAGMVMRLNMWPWICAYWITLVVQRAVSFARERKKRKRLRQALDDTSDLCNTILVDDAVETFNRYCTTHIESFDDIPSQPAAAPPEGEPSAGDGNNTKEDDKNG